MVTGGTSRTTHITPRRAIYNEADGLAGMEKFMRDALFPCRALLLFLLTLPATAVGYTGYGTPFTGDRGMALGMYIPDTDSFILQGVEVTLDLFYYPVDSDTTGTGELYVTLTHGDTTVPLVDLRRDTEIENDATLDRNVPMAHLGGSYTFADDASDEVLRTLSATNAGESLPDGAYLPVQTLDEGGFAGERANDMWTLRITGTTGWKGSLSTWKVHLIPATPATAPEPTSLLLVGTVALGLLARRRSG